MKNSNLENKIWFRLIKVLYILIFITILGLFNYYLITEEEIAKIDNNKTTINCNLEDKKVFTPNLISLDLNYNISDLKNGFNYQKFYSSRNTEYTVEVILKKCYNIGQSFVFSKDTDIYDVQKHLEIKNKFDSKDYSSLGAYIGKTVKDEEVPKLKEYETYVEYEKYWKETREKETELKKSLSGIRPDYVTPLLIKLPYLDFSAQFFSITPIFSYKTFALHATFGNLIILIVFLIVRQSFYYIANSNHKD